MYNLENIIKKDIENINKIVIPNNIKKEDLEDYIIEKLEVIKK